MYKSKDFEEKIFHCRCCGARLKDGKTEYCNERCRRRGQRLWRLEQIRRRKWLSDPIGHTVRNVEEYNKSHGTNLSYGQFVAQVLPKLVKGV
ncbi:MAG: hypothetical protein MJ091_02490 [Clostridia bacterium]|nr:hypothetical protein [Clostridia bacterium]